MNIFQGGTSPCASPPGAARSSPPPPPPSAPPDSACAVDTGAPPAAAPPPAAWPLPRVAPRVRMLILARRQRDGGAATQSGATPRLAAARQNPSDSQTKKNVCPPNGRPVHLLICRPHNSEWISPPPPRAWSTHAAHLAVRVCYQPPQQLYRLVTAQSGPLWLHNAVTTTAAAAWRVPVHP